MKRPAISVIIPTLNEAKYIHYAAEGLARQTFKDFEVIVVDGGSRDKTRAIAKKFAKVILAKGANVSRSRNIGAKMARGTILMFLDGDTKLGPSALAEYDRTLNNGYIAATGPIYPLEKTKRRVRMAYKFVTVDLIRLSIIFGVPSLVGANFSVRKDVFDRVHGFNESYITSEDWDLSQRVKKFGKIAYLGKAVALTSARRTLAWGLSYYTKYTLKNIINYNLRKKPSSDYEKVR